MGRWNDWNNRSSLNLVLDWYNIDRLDFCALLVYYHGLFCRLWFLITWYKFNSWVSIFARVPKVNKSAATVLSILRESDVCT